MQHGLGQAARLRPEEESIARFVSHVGIALRTAGGDGEEARRLHRGHEGLKVRVFVDARHLVIVEARAFHPRFRELETQRVDQVQRGARIGAQAYDIARIRRYLRLVQHDAEHG